MVWQPFGEFNIICPIIQVKVYAYEITNVYCFHVLLVQQLEITC